MARPGVSYGEVADAATYLLAQNKNPTIEQIRLYLGTGSSTTIANHLKRWKEQQKDTCLLASKENIPTELITTLKALWEQVIDHSERKLATAEAAYEITMQELRQDVQKFKNNNQRWQHLFNQWMEEKNQLLSDKTSLNQLVDDLQKEKADIHAQHETIAKQLEEKKERIIELNRLHAQTQKNLEHYRESVREQRAIEQQQFEQQRDGLRIEVKSYKEQIAVMRESLFVLQQQHQSLQQQHTELEKNHGEVTSQFKQMKIDYSKTEKTKTELTFSNQHLQEQVQLARLSLDSKDKLIIDSQAQVKMLTQQLNEVKQSLAEALQQNKLMSQEKWLLLQEKGQLEGQVKQMQKC